MVKKRNIQRKKKAGSNGASEVKAEKRQIRDAATTRQAILDAATLIMLKKGFAASSISEIAEEAGVTKSLIHHHFGSKKNLWHAIRDSFLGEFYEAQDQVLKTRVMDRSLIEDYFDMFFHYLRKHPRVIQLFIWVYAMEESLEEEETLSDMVDVARTRLLEAQKEGRIRDDIDTAFIIVAFRVLTLRLPSSS